MRGRFEQEARITASIGRAPRPGDGRGDRRADGGRVPRDGSAPRRGPRSAPTSAGAAPARGGHGAARAGRARARCGPRGGDRAPRSQARQPVRGRQREQGAPLLKVLDFGIAKIIADAGGPGKARRSASRRRCSWHRSSSPAAATPVSAAADRPALAHVAYMLLVGECYFDPEAEQETAMLAFARRVVGAQGGAFGAGRTPEGVHLPQGGRRLVRHISPPIGSRQAAPVGRPRLVEHLECARPQLRRGADTSGARCARQGRLAATPPRTGGDPGGGDAAPRRSGSSISGTTTPHRPQPDARGSRTAMVAGAGRHRGGPGPRRRRLALSTQKGAATHGGDESGRRRPPHLLAFAILRRPHVDRRAERGEIGRAGVDHPAGSEPTAPALPRPRRRCHRQALPPALRWVRKQPPPSRTEATEAPPPRRPGRGVTEHSRD